MTSPHRRPYGDRTLALVCPRCKGSLYVTPPSALVSVTSCPHAPCQSVIFACQDRAMPHGRPPSAVDAQTLMGGLDCPMESPRVVLLITAILLVFITVPLYAWSKAWQGTHPPMLEAVVVMGSAPSLLVGTILLVGMMAAHHSDWRHRRRVSAARFGALEDAPRLDAQRFADVER